MWNLLLNKNTIIALLILSACGYVYYLDNKVETQSATIIQLQKDNDNLNNLKDEFIKIRNKADLMDTKIKQIDVKLSNNIQSLESKIGRGDVVVKKPELVEIKINKSYAEFANRFDCAMGITKCD